MNLNINWNVVNGVLRSLVPALVAYLVGKGYLTESSAAGVGAALVALISAGWSVKSNTTASMITEVSAMPEVKQIIVAPSAPTTAVGAIASDPQQPKVVTG
jgi:hypothetical protein